MQLDSCVEAHLLLCCFVSMMQAASAAAHPPAPTASLLRRLGVRIRYCDLSAFTYGCSSSGICYFATTSLPTIEGPWLNGLCLRELMWRSVRLRSNGNHRRLRDRMLASRCTAHVSSSMRHSAVILQQFLIAP